MTKPLDPMPEEPAQPKSPKYAISTSADLKRSQSRGGRNAQRAGKIERVFREMDEESGE
jgi:hypothetical protein